MVRSLPLKHHVKRDEVSMRNKIQLSKLLVKAFSLAMEKGKLPEFLVDLFTPTELESVGRRLEAMIELSRDTGKKLNQAQIAQAVGCAPAVVSRANGVLKYGRGAAREVIKRILE
jgi:uncharacterized protein YerC